MKKLLVSYLGLSLALFSRGALNAAAGYVSPKVAPRATAASQLLANDSNGIITPTFPFPPANVRLVTNHADNGPGSLRYAISNAAAGDMIRFALRLPATILLRSSLVIDKDLTILGPDPRKLTVARTFNAHAPNFRVFRVDAGVVTIAGLSIVNGRALHGDGFEDNLGGGIFNEGSLTVSNCIIACNTAPTEGDNYGFGGGIFTLGPLTVLNSTIRGNEATYGGGGICTLYSDNVRIEGCTISGNFAGVQGGGVNFQGRAGSLKNCTISGNRTAADGTASALLHIVFEAETSDLALTTCTIARNHGNTNGAVVIAGLTNNLGITTRMIGTLVADNAAPNFYLDGNPVLQSLGHNLDSDGTSGLLNGVNGDLVGTPENPLDARLGSLQNNGGPTWTHALLHGSPAVDAGACSPFIWGPFPPILPLPYASEQSVIIIRPPVSPPPPPPIPFLLGTDQRGLPRPQGADCDIGAFENQPPLVQCPTARPVEACGAKLTAVVDDPDGDALSILWTVDGAAYQTNFLLGVHPPRSRVVELNVSLPSGEHTIGLLVSDGKAAIAECSTTVTVSNPKPPKIISIKADPKVLWPPNHKLVPVRVSVRVKDGCGPVKCRIISVQSNEPTGPESDWVITGDLTLLLRAERLGNGHGRIYTINVQCRDAAGNTSTGTVEVAVPKNR
jgi:parallel beta-helix repeat protein